MDNLGIQEATRGEEAELGRKIAAACDERELLSLLFASSDPLTDNQPIIVPSSSLLARASRSKANLSKTVLAIVFLDDFDQG